MQIKWARNQRFVSCNMLMRKSEPYFLKKIHHLCFKYFDCSRTPSQRMFSRIRSKYQKVSSLEERWWNYFKLENQMSEEVEGETEEDEIGKIYTQRNLNQKFSATKSKHSAYFFIFSASADGSALPRWTFLLIFLRWRCHVVIDMEILKRANTVEVVCLHCNV